MHVKQLGVLANVNLSPSNELLLLLSFKVLRPIFFVVHFGPVVFLSTKVDFKVSNSRNPFSRMGSDKTWE